jgi:hypothetical protein
MNASRGTRREFARVKVYTSAYRRNTGQFLEYAIALTSNAGAAARERSTQELARSFGSRAQPSRTGNTVSCMVGDRPLGAGVLPYLQSHCRL